MAHKHLWIIFFSTFSILHTWPVSSHILRQNRNFHLTHCFKHCATWWFFTKAVYVNFIEQRWQKYTLFTLVEVQILVLKNTLVKLLIRFLYSKWKRMKCTCSGSAWGKETQLIIISIVRSSRFSLYTGCAQLICCCCCWGSLLFADLHNLIQQDVTQYFISYLGLFLTPALIYTVYNVFIQDSIQAVWRWNLMNESKHHQLL